MIGAVEIRCMTVDRFPADHFDLTVSAVFRELIALIVRFNFRAINIRSTFDSSNAISCASSSGVHGRPVGRGPNLISPSSP
jgi:hypothetical protein